MDKVSYIIFIIFVAVLIGATGNYVKERIAFDIPQSAVFNNNFPQKRPRDNQEQNRNYRRREYNQDSSAKYNRRQNKMYNSGADRSYYENYYRQSTQY